MNSSQLLNSTFKRVSIFIESHNFKLRRLSNGDYAFYLNPDSKLHNYAWSWRNKKELMLGRKINDYIFTHSLFLHLIARYEYFKKYNIKNMEPISEPISENMLKFIDMCRCLKDCSCLEELVIKMDLMGI